jgi:flagella basal body P-ring formation protein FlgA
MSSQKKEPAMKWSRRVLTLVLAFASTACVLLKTDERIDVVVAATDLGAGRKITDRNITITSMPVSARTRDMPRKSSQVVGHTTKVPIAKGELILLSEVK